MVGKTRGSAEAARLGRYELGERIGEGAMAFVYKARDPQIGRVLAIKVLRPEYRANHEYVARFLREARAAGALSHPNIVTIYDVGEADGAAYIAMELLDGGTLDHRLPGRPMAPERVIAIGAQLAEALGYAHAAGVIHRDIKPSNIHLGADGRSVKILDFGIARLEEASEAEAAQLETRVGQTLGTPRYMSPEQALGHPADARSDLFSAGVVLYELASGAAAFSAASASLLAVQIALATPEPILDRVPDLPRGLAFIIDKLMAREPARRFVDGAALAEALRREQARAGGARPGRPTAGLRLALGLAAASAGALIVVAALVSQTQVAAMRRVAIASGEATAAFVAGNLAERAADNATLPPAERDWLPAQAFVTVAAQDRAVKAIEIADQDGVVRAATASARIGVPIDLHPAASEDLSFVRPILYAGRRFGEVRIDLDGGALAAAVALSRLLMAGLAAAILAVVLFTTLVAARRAAVPIRRLQRALDEAASGRFDFRISYRGRDGFAGLYEAFNRLAASLEPRLEETIEPVAETGASPPGQPAGPAPATLSGAASWRERWRRALGPRASAA